MIAAIHSLLILGTCGVAVLLLCAGASEVRRKWLFWRTRRMVKRQWAEWAENAKRQQANR